MSLKIYYLDDEKDLLEMFKEIYESSDIQIQIFSEPKDLIAAARLNEPNLYVLDYRLPRTTGDDVALELNPNTPKILITGDLAVSPRAKFIKIFRKPYAISEMQQFIDSMLQKEKT